MRRIEILRVGEFTSANAGLVKFSQDDLDQVVANHQPVPLVVGHPKTNSPAYGWTKRVWREGDRLLAEADRVHPAFAKAVWESTYPNRSVKLSKGEKGWKLEHIGFLGGVAPAVEGLEEVEFASSDSGVMVEFMAGDRISAVLDGIRRFIVDQVGEEVAESYFSSEVLKEPQMSSQTSALEVELAKRENALELREFAAFVDDKVKEGRVLPADRAFWVELAESSDRQKLKEKLNCLPVIVELGKTAYADAPKDKSAEQVGKEAAKLVKDGKARNIVEAVNMIKGGKK